MWPKSTITLALFILISLLLSACEPGPTPTQVFPITPSITASLIPSPTYSPTAEVEGTEPGNPTDEPPSPAPSPEPLSTPAVVPESASCLIGTWSVVHESLVGYLTEAFDQSGMITFAFQTGEGDLFLTFDRQGVTNFVAEDLELQVAIPGVAAFSFLVQGDGLAHYAAEEGIIATWGHVSAMTSDGAGEVGGEQTDAAGTVVLTPEQIFIDSTGDQATFTWVDVPDDARFTEFNCEGDLLSLNVDGTLGSQWQRVIGK